jgi:hypothetical protein
MTEINISKIEPSDTVTVRGTVFSISENNCVVYFRAIGGPYSVTLAYSEIVGHDPAPEPLKIGDVVTALALGTPWVVIALDDGTAWLKLPNYSDRYTYMRISDLQRVEQP